MTGLVKDLVGKPKTIDDGRPGGFYVPRFRNIADKHPNFIRGYGFEGSSGSTMFPATPRDARVRRRLQEDAFATTLARSSAWAASAKCWRATRISVEIDPTIKDRWGIPVLALQLQVRRQRKEDVRGHGRDGAGDVRSGRDSRSWTSNARC